MAVRGAGWAWVWPWALGLAAAAGCTRPNAAYDEDGGTVGAGASSTEPGATGVDAGESTSTPVDTTGGVGGTGETGASSGDGTIVPDICRVDLYAINDAGELDLLDLEESSWINVATEPELISLAIATEPARGYIFVSERDNPAVLWRVNPITFQIDPMALSLPAQVFPVLGRAGFDSAGTLWLGTESGSIFQSYSLSDASVSEHIADGTGGGGDLVVLPTGQVLVVDAEGNGYLVDFASGMILMTPITGLPKGERPSGLAFDREGGLWMSVLGAEGTLYQLSIDGGRPQVVDMRSFGISITDLAPVVTLPGGC